MPSNNSKKRTVKYQENTDSETGDRNVEVTDEISSQQQEDVSSEEENSLRDQDDERYTPSSGS